MQNRLEPERRERPATPARRATARSRAGRTPGSIARLALGLGLVTGLAGGCEASTVRPEATACAAAVAASQWQAPQILARGPGADFDALIDALSRVPVVLIGESHERLEHHLTQLEIICRLHARRPQLAIGIEFVQQPFQSALDAYLAGKLDTEQWLKASEYYERWRYDFRLYEPIFRFAREQRIPVIALNVAAELTRKVARGGMAALSPAESEQLPAGVDAPGERYRARLQAAFEQHPEGSLGTFEHFVSAQLLWDEGMAARAAEYLERHPGRPLVILAGNGHVAYRDAIPDRLARRAGVETVALAQSAAEEEPAVDAQYRLISPALELPPAGKLGAYLNPDPQGVEVTSFTDGSAAQAAGVRAGDVIVSVNGRPISGFGDIKIALWRLHPGERVVLEVRRDGNTLSYELELG